jgi:26S proteasome regulatory subunit N7
MTDSAQELTQEEHEENLQKTVGIGGRLDYILGLIRQAFSKNDLTGVSTYVARADKELSKGGDWERKNKLTVYKGLLSLCKRDFRSAAELLVSALATFTPCELLTFRDFVFYTVITSLVAMDRSTLKKKILDSPEILTVVDEVSHLKSFVLALHECRYADWSACFVELIDAMRADRYLNPHLRYITRAMRIVAYKQFLLSYKSVTTAMMAHAFGVSEPFIEEELSAFISAGKLHCKIDRINKFVESNRLEDPRNVMYARVIRQGDLQLNRIQKLSRVIDV